MKKGKFPVIATIATLIAVPISGNANDDELEFEEARVFFELNDTDGDLGIHGKVDGDAWKRVKIEGPNGRSILKVNTRGGIRRQGMTELFFESAEPCFPDNEECEDPLDPEVFFARFPQGEYEWEGKTLDGEEIEGETYLSHRIPAAPVVASIGNAAPPAGEGECWGEPGGDDVEVDWEPVTHTHASLGIDTGTPLGDNQVIYYEFVAEIDGTDYVSRSILPPEVTAWTIPEDFIDLADGQVDEDGEPVEEIKFEVLVRVETGDQVDDDGEAIESRPGNKSAVEGCFEI